MKPASNYKNWLKS